MFTPGPALNLITTKFKLYINIENDININSIEIKNSKGVLVYRSAYINKRWGIDITQFPGGTYTVAVALAKKTIQQNIEIQN